MQEINNEYFQLFPIWKNISKDTSTETAQSTQEYFYSQNGWKGENYNINLRMTDITKIIREFAKEKYLTYKFSICKKHYNALSISLMEAPEEIFIAENLSPQEKESYDNQTIYIQINHYYIEKEHRITELTKEILEDIRTFAQTYNYDDSDSMTDYFDTNFYLSMSIGRWDKPFKVVKKYARKKPEKNDRSGNEITDLNIRIIDYSEKSIAVIGDTYPIREELSELDGKYNPRLKCGKGWIFPISKREQVEKLIQTTNFTN